MTGLVERFTIAREPAGNLVIAFRLPIAIPLIALALLPFAGTAAYVAAGNPLKIPLAVVPAFFVVLAVLCAAPLIWQSTRSRARIRIDRSSASVVIDTRSGRTELPLRDIEKAQLGSAAGVTAKGARITRYRLEFILRNGQFVPATADYYYASPAAREQLLEILNEELGARRAMLS